MIKVRYNEQTGEFLGACDASLTTPDTYVLMEDTAWNNLVGYKIKISHGEVVVDLDDAKSKACNTLWKNYKAHQTKYVDAEDLTLASLCAAGGSAKGKAVQAWVMGLWKTYYTVKDLIATASTKEVLDAINLTATDYGEPPYTIRELNEEAAAVMATGTEATDENEGSSETEGA